MRTDAQTTGDAAEAAVAAALTARGWTILGRNVRVGRGEIDLVGVDPGPPPNVVIVEVRWRRDRRFGLAEETVDWRKRAHLRAAVARLRADERIGEARLPAHAIRVDLVVVEPGAVRHHRHLEL